MGPLNRKNKDQANNTLILPLLWVIIPIVPPVLITRTFASALGLISESILVALEILLLRTWLMPLRHGDICELKTSDWSRECKWVWDKALAREVISVEGDNPETDRFHLASMTGVFLFYSFSLFFFMSVKVSFCQNKSPMFFRFAFEDIVPLKKHGDR